MNEIYLKNVSFALNPQRVSEFFTPSQLRRMSGLQKLSLYCAAKLLKQENLSFEQEKEDIALIIAAGRGMGVQTCAFLDSIIEYGDLCASPLSFAASIHNAIETALTINLNFRGPCLTISQGHNSFESSLQTARVYLLSKTASSVLIGAVDEANPVILKEYGGKTVFTESAAFFLFSQNCGGKSICLLSEIENALKNAAVDEFNPSLAAFNIARGKYPLLPPQNCQKIISDIIKTKSASKKKEVLSVFENENNPRLFSKIDQSQKKEIENEIKAFFGAEFSIDEHSGDFSALPLKCAQAVFEKDGISFSTSGSQGLPKICPHSFEALREEIIGVSFLFKKIKRIISLAPAHHSYGFIFGMQLGKYLDIETQYHSPLPNLQWDKILKEGDLFIVFPLFLNYLKELDFIFPSKVTLLTSTAPCPDELIDYAYKNGAENIIEIYGSSETGAIGYRQRAKEPFNLLPFWSFVEGGGGKQIFRQMQGVMDLPDNVEILQDKSFFVKGRKDTAVQVAGINVYPKRVESVLKKQAYIKDISIRLGDKKLKAFIVLKEGISEDLARKDIFDFMNKNLTTQEIPQNIVFGKSIPVNHLGKKQDF
ncbi:MAG: beta-ketoacyl synthase chain length factor [Elusimicrobiota bacterium]|jgi:4-coumarate--CoA ligase (photoactive yellow protein activation family)|nr:beta-ketoacyl synthase chain length factor [Elusimicrobiota bacterium]